MAPPQVGITSLKFLLLWHN
uniref:Uncharacterized protein n=1 Tax=Rhizophora mucronata TaxID=61149 RepID=A0A2P2MDA2_RHIMU